MDNFLDDGDGLKNLNSIISPPSEHGNLNHLNTNSPGRTTMGSRNPQVPIPGDKEYLSTIKKKIALGENNNKVFNRFGQGSNARN